MIKNNLDYKLINIAVIAFIVFLIYMTSDFWCGFVSKLFSIFTPFIIAFAIAHAFYPLLKKMEKRDINKVVGIIIIMLFLLGLIGFIISLIIPLIFEQTSGLFSGIIKFINDISIEYDVNLGHLQLTLANTFDNIINNLEQYVTDGALNIIGKSFKIISITAVILFVTIYFLIDMKRIRNKVKEYLKKANKRTYKFIKILDYEMSRYFLGMGQFMLWQLFEYTVIFYLIGHPHYLLLGILAAVTNVIPYLGAIITNIIAGITAFAISSHLFILTIIVILVLSSIDSYIMSPKIFGGTNKIPPLLTIFSVFAGGIIAGIPGIIVALPLTIIIMNTFKFYKDDICLIVKSK